MKEQSLEKYFVDKIKKRCCLCIKLNSQSMIGLPDRMVLLPKGAQVFVEFKAPGEVLRPVQLRRKKELEALGFLVFIVDCKQTADAVLEAIVYAHDI